MTEDTGDVQGPQPDKKIRESVADIPLGIKGGSRQPALGALHIRGIDVPGSTLGRLRGGHTSGTKIEERVLASDILSEDDASKKDELYIKIAKKGIELRRRQDPPNSHKLNSEGFTEELARNFDMKPQVVRRLIRAMRADMVYAQRQNPDPVFSQRFKYIADDFIDAYVKQAGTSSAQSKRNMEELEAQWDGEIESFYKLMYERLSHRSRGAWTPYEIEAFSEFYVMRRKSGSRLTPFDRLILTSRNQRRETSGLVDIVRESTGIPIDHNNIEAHRSALLYTREKFSK